MWNRGLTGLRRFTTSSRRLNITSTSTSTKNVENPTQESINPNSNLSKSKVEELQQQEKEEEDDDSFRFQKLNSEEANLIDRQIREIVFGETPSNELNKALSENQTLKNELKSFLDEFASRNIINEKKRSIQKGPNKNHPFLIPSNEKNPYTSQELYLRREHFISQVSKLGSNLQDVYIPHHEVFYPAPISKISISKLLASGAHLGHSTSLYRSSNQPYILGSYKGIHIIDLEQTLTHLRRASKIVEGVSERGGIILFIGTKDQLTRPLELAAKRSNGYYVSSRWVPGTITNCTEISTWERQEVDFEDKPTNRELNSDEMKSFVKPDLVIILNPVENRVAVRECIQAKIPTIGVIDTDSEASLVTYPIPANDDSIRCLTLLIGVLSKAGESGRRKRLQKIQNYKAKNESLISTVKETEFEKSKTEAQV